VPLARFLGIAQLAYVQQPDACTCWSYSSTELVYCDSCQASTYMPIPSINPCIHMLVAPKVVEWIHMEQSRLLIPGARQSSKDIVNWPAFDRLAMFIATFPTHTRCVRLTPIVHHYITYATL
jgi:hypothetical protein